MPTVLRNGPYRRFFYAGEHVERDFVKFWLDPARLAGSGGMAEHCLPGLGDESGEVFDIARRVRCGVTDVALAAV